MGNENSAKRRKRQPKDDAPIYKTIKTSLNLTGNPLTLTGLHKLVLDRKMESGIHGGYKQEYNELPTEPLAMTTAADLKENIDKNRNNQVKPYDQTRVILRGSTGGDYINASYIYGYQSKPNKYIATQGPISATVADFWYMIWQEDVATIVMMAPTDECQIYWPASLDDLIHHGHVMITLDNEQVTAYWTYRVMTLHSQNKTKQVKQYQFTAWLNEDRPENTYSVLDLIKRVYLTHNGRGPIVVHCSTGVGRTGAFIALDYLIAQLREEGQVDVKTCVHQLNCQRASLVQNVDQYAFLYEALDHGYKFGKTALTPIAFRKLYKKIRKLEMPSELKQQFEALDDVRARFNPECDGLKPLNMFKNRDLSIIPDDKFRPLLISPSVTKTNYINAVFLDTFTKRKNIIVTQIPMPRLQAHFWNIVSEYTCNIVVLLCNSAEVTDQVIPKYRPLKEQTEEYNEFTVTAHDKTRKTTYTDLHNLTLLKEGKEPVSLSFYEFTAWPLSPNEWTKETCVQVLQLIEFVQEEQFKNPGARVLVHCLDGASKSGLFCALYIILERVRVYQEVDIALACQMIVSRRAAFINTLVNYRTLHTIVKNCLKHLATKKEFFQCWPADNISLDSL